MSSSFPVSQFLLTDHFIHLPASLTPPSPPPPPLSLLCRSQSAIVRHTRAISAAWTTWPHPSHTSPFYISLPLPAPTLSPFSFPFPHFRNPCLLSLEISVCFSYYSLLSFLCLVNFIFILFRCLPLHFLSLFFRSLFFSLRLSFHRPCSLLFFYVPLT